LRVNGEEDSRFLLAGATGTRGMGPICGRHRTKAGWLPRRCLRGRAGLAGVPQDYVSAHQRANWHRPKGAAESRDEFAARMTPAQIAEAEKLAREWKIASR
jgi:hypothetical protein